MGVSYEARAMVAFENGKSVDTVDFNYDAIDAYCFGVDSGKVDADFFLSAFTKAFEWVANVRPNDFKGMAIRVQVVRCALLNMPETQAAKEIGVTKQAISQRMSDFRDTFQIKHPTSNLRTEETRQKFSQLCSQRHQQRKTSSSSLPSPTT